MKQVEITFHSDNGFSSNAHPAINVKVRHLPEVEADESIRELAYEHTKTRFWEEAGFIARDHGYSGVFSEGRSGGWLVPYTQHDAHGKLVTRYTGQGPDKGYPVYPNVEDKTERKQFIKFRDAIEKLLAEVPTLYREAITAELAE